MPDEMQDQMEKRRSAVFGSASSMQIMAGELVPGYLDPLIRQGMNSYQRLGDPIPLGQPKVTTYAPHPPLGDQRHGELLGAIKNLTAVVSQNVVQETSEALQGTRSWRG